MVTLLPTAGNLPYSVKKLFTADYNDVTAIRDLVFRSLWRGVLELYKARPQNKTAIKTNIKKTRLGHFDMDSFMMSNPSDTG